MYIYIYICRQNTISIYVYTCLHVVSHMLPSHGLPKVLGRMDGPSSCPRQGAGEPSTDMEKKCWKFMPAVLAGENLKRVSNYQIIEKKTYTYMLSTSNLQRTAPTTTKR